MHATDDATIIAALGDSVTQATPHVSAQESFVARLEQALNRRLTIEGRRVEVVNAGIAGENSAEGLARITRDVPDRHPTLVLIEFGLNDVRYEAEKAICIDDFKTNLRTMTARIRDAGAHSVLMTPNPVINAYHVYSRATSFYRRWGGCDQRLAHYADAVRQVAESQDVPLCDIRRAFIDRAIEAEFRGATQDHTDLTALRDCISPDDGVHPVALGHELIAFALYNLLGRRPDLLERPSKSS